MSRPTKRRRGGKGVTDGKWERWELFATVARFVVELLQLVSDHLSGGALGASPE
jgi:hypothetical protein